uniref:ATPase AAA (FtsH, hflB) n=1 Tax=uncultured marine group II/III euryarchaeote KM3_92_B07 TaxID=1456543 RepID=A0A075I445_9EURY|nr:ATPase AAA (ftsH, hflB) [uncultured marine group II/III euryarchaeote KM3_92_B07]
MASDNGDDPAPLDEATPSLGEADLSQISDAAFTLWENIHSTREELKKKKESAGKLFSNEVSDFLGVAKSDWGWSSNMFYNDNGFYLMHLLDFLDREFTIQVQTNYKTNSVSYVDIDEHVGIRYKILDLGRGVKHSLPHSAVFFIESEGGTEKLVLTLDSSSVNPYENELTEGQIIYDSIEHQEQSFWDRFREDFYANGPLKGERFGADLRLLDYDPNLGMDDIILDEKVKLSLEKNIAGFIRAIPALERAGHRTSRGIMMAGVPGTGKTLYCKILLNMVDLTTIYVTRARMSKGLTLKHIYRLARKLSPSLVLIEDIDTVGGMDRRAIEDEGNLGSLLEILEGIEPNTKVITVVTTNYPQHLDEALRNRPGRIDTFINIEVPNREQRREMLKGMTSDVKLAADIDWDELVKLTKGMTGAYLREVVASAILTFTFNCQDEEVILDNESLIDACKESRERMEKSKVDITYEKMPELEKDDKQAWG